MNKQEQRVKCWHFPLIFDARHKATGRKVRSIPAVIASNRAVLRSADLRAAWTAAMGETFDLVGILFVGSLERGSVAGSEFIEDGFYEGTFDREFQEFTP